jgi:hypothetical protein
MTYFTINKKEHIQYIIDSFNFEKVRKTMELLHWTWLGSDKSPTIDELKMTARMLLYNVCDDNCDSSSTGGFKATRYDDHLELEFIISEYDSSMLNSGPIYEIRKKLKTRKKKIDTINRHNK